MYKRHTTRLSDDKAKEFIWVETGYQGKGKEWAEKVLGGLSVEVVPRTPKPTPEKVARIWAEEWSKKGWQTDWQKTAATSRI